MYDTADSEGKKAIVARRLKRYPHILSGDYNSKFMKAPCW